MIEFVFNHFAAEGVAVDSQDFCGARLVAIGAVEDALDEALFEFTDGLVKEDAALDHLQYQTFQLISHSITLPKGMGFKAMSS
jgi:hypothetical protein